MAKWRNKIEIKKYFTDDNSNESVLMVLSHLIPQLKFIVKSERKLLKKINDERHSENVEYLIYKLEELIDEFEWIQNSIKEKQSPTEYGAEMWVDIFNEYLDELYDLGDSPINFSEDPFEQKFLWVG